MNSIIQDTIHGGEKRPDLSNNQEELTKVTIEVSLSYATIWNLLICAIEGGSNYWYMIRKTEFAPGLSRKNFTYIHEIPFTEGCTLWIGDKEDNKDPAKPLNLETMKTGLKVMSEKYPRHFRNLVDENEDAETGDVFLQCCLFGEIVYG